ncbi:hypothetical protein JG688_00002743 [Phytophthora aleatoria]|uniref:BRCT domain-containing protein n=1 Tax=Phytophthora aleatoria TaxID=2496075 RepID=A0A8J5M8H8_9STRA|nr:hypothetical protein JG688_00002743 [Phytophthora aleatoria]
MFAVNGPSGPTTRNERRVKSDRQREEEEETRRRWAEKKREQFFLEKRAQADSTMHGVECTGVCKGNCNISAHSLCLPYTSDKEEAKQCAAQSNIFKGCRIVFNGRTGKVSSYYLAKLVQDHGGNVASALTTTRVTHMVGSNLNGSKADKVLKSCGKVKFVSPEWILQSVKHNQRQPEFEFLVYKDSHVAGTLHAAFSRAVPSTKGEN